MSLFPNNGHDRYISYDATGGCFLAPGGAPVDLVATRDRVLFDMGSLEVGWDLYGDPSSRVLVPYVPGEFPDAPSVHHVPAVRLVVSSKAFAGARLFATSTRSMLGALQTLHTAFEAAPEAVAGLIPVVEVIATKAFTTTNGTFYHPVFQIVEWVERPAAFGPRISPVPAAKIAAPVAASVEVPVAAQVEPDQVERALDLDAGKPEIAHIRDRVAKKQAEQKAKG